MLLNFTLLFYFILFFLLFWFKTDLDSNQQIKYKERESNRRRRLTTSAKIVWKPTANHSKIVRRIPTTARRRWKPQPKTFSFEKKCRKIWLHHWRRSKPQPPLLRNLKAGKGDYWLCQKKKRRWRRQVRK